MSAHLFIIHFPVSLAIIAAVLDLLGVGLDDQTLRNWSWRFLLVAAIAVFGAFATGEGARFAAMAGNQVDLPRLEYHQQWGSAGLWAIVGAGLLRSLWRNRLSGIYGWINLTIALASAALIIAITLSGMAIRHAP